MKNILLAISVIISAIFMVSPAIASPELIQGCSGAASASAVCKDQGRTDNPLFGKTGIITSATRLLAVVTGVLSVFYIIISGLRYVNSSGDPSKTKSARDGIIYACVGIAITMVAGSVVQFILIRL